MKKYIALTLIIIFSFCSTISSNANTTSNIMIEYTNDGGYDIVELFSSTNTTRTTQTKGKHLLHYDNTGKLVWKFTLTGEFTYNGTTATCQTTSNSVEVYDSDWVVMSRQSYPSGNQAIGIIKIKPAGQLPMEKVPTLTCSPNGTVQ